MIVAITGRSGSGKSYVAKHYASLGYTVIDADKVTYDVLSSDKQLREELAEAFGKDILDENGNLLRKELANKAFLDEESASRLTKITHPHIVSKIMQIAHESKASPIFVDGAVIVGELFEQYCDKIIVITAPHTQAVSRIVQRDKISYTAAENRLNAQMEVSKLVARADYVIENNNGKEALLIEAEKVLKAMQASF